MGIQGLGSSLLPRHTPGFFLSLSWKLDMLLFGLSGFLFTLQCRNAPAKLLECRWSPCCSCMPRSRAQHSLCPPAPHTRTQSIRGAAPLHLSAQSAQKPLPSFPRPHRWAQHNSALAYLRPPRPQSLNAHAQYLTSWTLGLFPHQTHSALTLCARAALFLPDTALVLLLELLHLYKLLKSTPKAALFQKPKTMH